MEMRETPLSVLIKGCLSGIAGALTIRLAMQAAAPPPPTEPRPSSEEPRHVFVRRLVNCFFEKEMPESEQEAWAELSHWAYGSAWGEVYGVVQSSLRLPGLLHGLLLGTVVWVVGPLFLGPAMKLTPPPRPAPVPQTLKGWGFHAVYGVTTALVFDLLSLGRRD